jgi:integrase
MTTNALQPVEGSAALLRDAIQTYLAGRSPHTRRAYHSRLKQFMAWLHDRPPAPFVAHLRDYIAYLQERGLSPRSVQAHTNTIKGLLRTAAALDTSGNLATALPTLDLAKPPSVRGEVQGSRLTTGQRQTLLDLPGTTTHKGRRDSAILALMSVCGLRRAEVVALNWAHIAELDGHKVIKNLTGKHGRTRTVKMPPTLWRLLQVYAGRAELDMSPGAPVFVRIRKGDEVQHGERLTSSAIGWLVDYYTGQLGFYGISPHDLRRTAAKLARQGGASIEQVQVMLGHASPQTTSAYIGEMLDLDDHAVDYSRVRITVED